MSAIRDALLWCGAALEFIAVDLNLEAKVVGRRDTSEAMTVGQVLDMVDEVLGQEPLDVEQILKDCVPGGSSCDPQAIADEIRAWFARRSAGDPTRLAVPCVQPSAETRSARRWRLHWCGRTSATSGHGSGGR